MIIIFICFIILLAIIVMEVLIFTEIDDSLWMGVVYTVVFNILFYICVSILKQKIIEIGW